MQQSDTRRQSDAAREMLAMLRQHTVNGRVMRTAILAKLDAASRAVHGHELTREHVAVVDSVIAAYKARQPFRLGW
jgi:transposase-like protein